MITKEVKEPGDLALEYFRDTDYISKVGFHWYQSRGQHDNHLDYLHARDMAARKIAYAIVDNMQYSVEPTYDNREVTHIFKFAFLMEEEREKLTNQNRKLWDENAELSERIHYLKTEPIVSIIRGRLYRKYLDLKMKFNRWRTK